MHGQGDQERWSGGGEREEKLEAALEKWTRAGQEGCGNPDSKAGFHPVDDWDSSDLFQRE